MTNNNSETNRHMNNPEPPYTNNNNRILGIAIVVLGILLFVKTSNITLHPIVSNIVSFPTFLIILGLILGYKKRYNTGGWLFLIGAGVYFLLRKFDHDLGRFALPIILIIAGLFIISNNKKRQQHVLKDPEEGNPFYPGYSQVVGSEQPSTTAHEGPIDAQGEFVRMEAIFSGNERIVISNNFKGGKVGTVFGGAILDCKAANIQQDVVIDVYCVFGNIELILPANWRVINETTTIFGGLEDKRRLVHNTGLEKKVIITGFSLFGGIEIKNI